MHSRVKILLEKYCVGEKVYMDHKLIYDSIIEYENMQPQEILDQIIPIIKSYNKQYLSTVTNISEHTLYQYCKTLYINSGKKPEFDNYIKLMCIDVNSDSKKYNNGVKVKRPNAGRKKKEYTKEEIEELNRIKKENKAKYQREYYFRVTKKKRISQRQYCSKKKYK